MTTLTQAYDALAIALESAIGVEPIRGWPRWSLDEKPTQAVSILLATSHRLKPGAGRKRSHQYGIQVVLFDEDEDALFDIVEAMEAWLDNTSHLTTDVPSQVKMTWDSPAVRHINESERVAEDYGFVYNLNLTW